ncbi:hypothetical protein TVAG_159860 [Trichomonas vaginalis G3]|uniref:Uncharacterized protein n=1 Tax=Trichomonas vaginalis (strain ATCC PRA-98 / G3) TaxID=412133 RepID=A2DUS8_TRIV3|nr:hypothetical protein TVAGG3_0259550 [Trichomonas vaginalis G3]EAY15813.1 hypothetical protein TVAG_159860 [Trichomonas vaginalis G3]KAI5525016.1 hypothetical protein TVAGG3_0259550 [Trichomonas vaginalis G3]|eukprot:XP_001328036.1 hypothetical protein [Trichomonas vaginalis G3]
MCLVELILFNLLFSYRNPGLNAIIFFRYLFLTFLITFVVIGLIILNVSSGTSADPDRPVSLWAACTDIILLIFFILPARALLKAVTYPMVQPDDVHCVNLCKVGLYTYATIYVARMLWNITHFFNINILQDYFYDFPPGTKAPPKMRAWSWIYFFIFDFVASVIAIISVYLFKKHDLMFKENPYYTRHNV